jgi:peptidoglycan hydrolase-like protein with peptidoglycan-binding domain
MVSPIESIFLFPVRSIKLWAVEDLELGDFGFAVQRLQERLIHLGFYDGPIDGYLSPETQSALRKAQSYFRLQVTGCCDAMTWQTLQNQKLATA